MKDSRSLTGTRTIHKPVLRAKSSSAMAAACCAICGGPEEEGVSCEDHHQLCAECCRSWLNSISEDAAKLRSHAGEAWLGCPHVGADGTWCDRPLLFEAISASMPPSGGYSDPMGTVTAAAGRVWQTRLGELREALNLYCPSCRTVLDPDPEACTAMAWYVVWLQQVMHNNSILASYTFLFPSRLTVRGAQPIFASHVWSGSPRRLQPMRTCHWRTAATPRLCRAQVLPNATSDFGSRPLLSSSGAVGRAHFAF